MTEPLNYPPKPVWPEWHNKPLKLTVQEIEDPTIVIQQFFQCYHLPDIRQCLQVWLEDSLAKNTVESKNHVFTHYEIEKLVEAAWVINHKCNVSITL